MQSAQLRLSVAVHQLRRRDDAAARRLRRRLGLRRRCTCTTPRWPAPYGDALYSCDWGTQRGLSPQLSRERPELRRRSRKSFLKIPRPTDIDVDGRGRMYVSSWKDGGFSYSGPNVGFVAQVKPTGFVPKPFPNLAAASDEELVGYLASPSAVYRLHSQRELLRRGIDGSRPLQLIGLGQRCESAALRPRGRDLHAQAARRRGGQRRTAEAGGGCEHSRVCAAGAHRSPQPAEQPAAGAVRMRRWKTKTRACKRKRSISLGRIGNAQAAEEVLALDRSQRQMAQADRLSRCTSSPTSAACCRIWRCSRWWR